MSGTVNAKKLRQPTELLLLHAIPESRLHKLPSEKALELGACKKIKPRKNQTPGSNHAQVAALLKVRRITKPMIPENARPNSHSFHRTPAIECEGNNLQISASRTAVPITADSVWTTNAPTNLSVLPISALRSLPHSFVCRSHSQQRCLVKVPSKQLQPNRQLLMILAAWN